MFDPGVDVDDLSGIIGDLGVAQPGILHHKPRKDTINTADVITVKQNKFIQDHLLCTDLIGSSTHPTGTMLGWSLEVRDPADPWGTHLKVKGNFLHIKLLYYAHGSEIGIMLNIIQGEERIQVL